MNIIEKLYEVREEEINTVTFEDKKEILRLYPFYYSTSNLEELIKGNTTLEKVFDEFFIGTSAVNSYFNKKAYLEGLKDGICISKFSKND